MPTLDLTADDLGNVRFAISPMSQLVGALVVLSGRGTPVGLEQWRADRLTDFRDRCAADPALPALAQLLRTTHYVPDCLSVPPRQTGVTIETELQELRDTPTARIRADLKRSADHSSAAGSAPVVELCNRQKLSLVLTETLGSAWRYLIAPDWPTIRAILERDIQHRADILVTRGLVAALGALDGDVRWSPSGRLGRRSSVSDPHQLTGAGLWLIPNAFGGGWLCLDGQGAFALTYAARGMALLGQAVPAPSHALPELIGRSRTLVLTALEQPATTTQLAGLLNMSIGAVGDHLAVLRKNQLVTRTRTGGSVLYARTTLAEALIGQSSPPE